MRPTHIHSTKKTINDSTPDRYSTMTCRRLYCSKWRGHPLKVEPNARQGITKMAPWIEYAYAARLAQVLCLKKGGCFVIFVIVMKLCTLYLLLCRDLPMAEVDAHG